MINKTVLCFFVMLTSVEASMEYRKDYCAFETFTPECGNDQVVLMTAALYGRMSIGKCVKRNYGHVGCKADVISYFDEKCSGRTTCSIDIPDRTLSEQVTCFGELRPYLQASYTCQKVYIPNTNLCHTIHHITATSRSGNYLASLTTKKTLCGLDNTPYIISAKPGQHLKLSLIDFYWNKSESDESSCSMKYGYIIDIENDNFISICGGFKKRYLVYKSSGHSVQVVFDSLSIQQHNFLIKYEVVDCPDITPPSGSWITKSNDTITIGCHNNDDRWRLTCIDNRWLGYIGNCSGGVTVGYNIEGQSEIEGSGVFTSNHVLAFTLGCVTLIVCLVTVIVGFYFIKRYDSRRTTDVPPLHYDEATILSSRTMGAFHPVHTSTLQGRSQSHLAQCTLPMLHNKPPLIPQRTSSYNSNTVARCQNAPCHYQPQTEGANFQFFPGHQSERNLQYLGHCQTGNMFNPCVESHTTNNPYNISNSRPGNQCLLDVFDDINSNCIEPNKAAESPHYFVLENQRESVTSDTEQLYQSIHYKSTDHITS